MKKTIALSLILILIFGSLVAYAEPAKDKDKGKPGKAFIFKGLIVQIKSNKILVHAVIANKKGEKYVKEDVTKKRKGKNITFILTTKTRIEGKGKIHVADLAIGDDVMLKSKKRLSKTSFRADKILVKKAKGGRIKKFVFDGVIEQVGEDKLTINVEDTNKPARKYIGKSLVIAVKDDTKVIDQTGEKGTIDMVEAGQTVRVLAEADKEAEIFGAYQIKIDGEQEEDPGDDPGEEDPDDDETVDSRHIRRR